MDFTSLKLADVINVVNVTKHYMDIYVSTYLSVVLRIMVRSTALVHLEN